MRGTMTTVSLPECYTYLDVVMKASQGRGITGHGKGGVRNAPPIL